MKKHLKEELEFSGKTNLLYPWVATINNYNIIINKWDENFRIFLIPKIIKSKKYGDFYFKDIKTVWNKFYVLLHKKVKCV